MSERQRPRITVINDHDAFLDLIADALGGSAGYDVVTHLTNATSIEAIAADHPDLLMVDLRRAAQEGLTGWQIVTLARVHPQLRSVPVIICSGDVRFLQERSAELSAMGDVHSLEKPFDLAALEELTTRLLTREEPSI